MTIAPAFPSLTRDEVFRIETRRLWLRWPRHDDAVALAAWVGLPEVAEMTAAFRVGITAAEMANVVAANRQGNIDGHSLSFVMTRKGCPVEPIGRVGVGLKPGGELELGYNLSPTAWGRGLMTEAVAALCAQAFELSDRASIIARVQPANAGSIRVLEKCGFRQTGASFSDSPVRGRHPLLDFALARRRPSSLLLAQRRFRPATALDFAGAA